MKGSKFSDEQMLAIVKEVARMGSPGATASLALRRRLLRPMMRPHQGWQADGTQYRQLPSLDR